MRVIPIAAWVLALLAASIAAQGMWSTPVEVKAVNSSTQDYYVHISGDGKILRVSSSRTDLPGRVGGWDIYYATRTGPFGSWSTLQIEPGAINHTSNDVSQHVLSDEMTAYYATARPGTGGHDIWMVTRNSPSAAWANPVEIKPANSTSTEYGVSVTDDDTYMLLWSSTGHFVECTRAAPTQAWSKAVPVPELNIGSSASGRDTRVSADGLTVYFCPVNAPGSVGGNDIYVATRDFRQQKWGTPTIVPTVNSTGTDRVPSISPDGRELYFTSSRSGGTGGQDVYVSYFTGLSYQNLPQLGSQLWLYLTHAQKPGANYQMALSLTNVAGIPIPGVGKIPLDPDPLFFLSVQNILPTVFMRFNGTLDPNGRATAALNILPAPALVGVVFHAAGVLYDNTGIVYISNGRSFGIHR
jgi:hypothetical protein